MGPALARGDSVRLEIMRTPPGTLQVSRRACAQGQAHADWSISVISSGKLEMGVIAVVTVIIVVVFGAACRLWDELAQFARAVLHRPEVRLPERRPRRQGVRTWVQAANEN